MNDLTVISVSSDIGLAHATALLFTNATVRESSQGSGFLVVMPTSDVQKLHKVLGVTLKQDLNYLMSDTDKLL